MTFFTNSNSNFKKAAVFIGFLASSANANKIELGTAGDFALLTKTGVTTTGVTSVAGDIGTSPITGTALTGFGLVMDSTDKFSTSTIVTGSVYAADYADTTPTMLNTAIFDMQTAYTDAAGRVTYTDADNQATSATSELGAGSVEGLTLAPGLYKWGTSVGFTNSLTFDGNADDIWILQISQSLIVGSGAIITLAGGAKAENIFWQIAGSATIGTTAHVEGVFLCQTAIVFMTGSSLNGVALAQTAVTLDSTTIVSP